MTFANSAAALVGVMVGLTAAGAGCARSAGHAEDTQQATVSTSEVTVGDFTLKPRGLLFSFHPTEARIVVSAVASKPLQVCEDGTTFSRYWKGGCRTLGRAPLKLPTSGGAVHVGFRVKPTGRAAAHITTLRVRWHCVDHAFIIVRGATTVGRAVPTFDC